MPARSTATVELPSGRAPGGWRLYSSGQISECPVHKYCAYDGTEPERCPECHTSERVGCEHNWGGIPGGTRPCRCRGCEEVFSSTAAFNRHQTSEGCLPPSSRKLVLAERGDWALWALPGERPQPAG